ncbi:hypothetical protein TPY_2726 [Sulfobacillus acidophilus TPY]|uniref:Uncharacterized protein n=1 Tax=Sulfobacillus acidophilus (strain ATCC 700253 / DSM 10332 / NAL) TaxID=679936 RepID=G8TUK8_SULAD|nr:hypothetical protein TPY_2726 [Sulfobacillus acidophilus TPY]AEW04655.1 hypothetical protein Sulac_1155 [Sulfobacillus acidophilus DSM 10332]
MARIVCELTEWAGSRQESRGYVVLDTVTDSIVSVVLPSEEEAEAYVRWFDDRTAPKHYDSVFTLLDDWTKVRERYISESA